MKNKYNIVLLAADKRYYERQAARTDAAVSAAALRVRRHRERTKAGKTVLSAPPIEIDQEFKDWLHYHAGLLPDPCCDDRLIIAQAIEKLHKLLVKKDKELRSLKDQLP